MLASCVLEGKAWGPMDADKSGWIKVNGNMLIDTAITYYLKGYHLFIIPPDGSCTKGALHTFYSHQVNILVAFSQAEYIVYLH